MKIKLGEVKGIAKGLEDILVKELPVKPAYWFGKLAKNIQQEVRDFEHARLKLIEKHGLRDESGKIKTEKDKYVFADAEAFNAEYAELANMEIEIDFKPIPLSSLSGINVSPVTMIALENFVADDEA